MSKKIKDCDGIIFYKNKGTKASTVNYKSWSKTCSNREERNKVHDEYDDYMDTGIWPATWVKGTNGWKRDAIKKETK